MPCDVEVFDAPHLMSSWFSKTVNGPTSTPIRRSTGNTDKLRSTQRNEEKESIAQLRRVYHNFASPHDEILGRIHGLPSPSESQTIASKGVAEEPELQQPQQRIGTSQPATHSPLRERSLGEVLYDPFDGTLVGPLQSSDAVSSMHDIQTGNDTKYDALWSSLSTILELQAQVARMHLDMEGVGKKPTGGTKGKKGKHPRAISGLGKGWSDLKGVDVGSIAEGEDEGDHDRVDDEDDIVLDDEASMEKEFAELQSQFEDRKRGIDGIMGKVLYHSWTNPLPSCG